MTEKQANYLMKKARAKLIYSIVSTAIIIVGTLFAIYMAGR